MPAGSSSLHHFEHCAGVFKVDHFSPPPVVCWPQSRFLQSNPMPAGSRSAHLDHNHHAKARCCRSRQDELSNSLMSAAAPALGDRQCGAQRECSHLAMRS
eukprot:15056440-Alexandrium_andersonii.AAC.1